MGSTGPAVDRPGDRAALRPELPRHHHRRHGARPGGPARRAGRRAAVRRWSAAPWAGCRRCSGRPSYPERIDACAVIACAARHTAQNIAFHEVGRQAVMADPDWRGGDYLALGVRPEKGLAVARMAAHVTYLSETGAAAEVRARAAGPRRPVAGASTPTSRWRATCATRARASSTASTPTPTSTSPAPWTTSTSPPPHDGVLAKAFEGARDVRFLRRRASPATGSIPPAKAAPWCAR